jgi:6-phosphofructokinase 1
VLYEHTVDSNSQPLDPTSQRVLSFECAGPREMIFFEPAKTTAGIVTCGGLCPGLNDIIKGLVMQLWNRYGVHRIYGFRYGYQGSCRSSGTRH